jgi:hypothetical protein
MEIALKARLLTTMVVLLVYIATAAAHEHHTDKIEAGEGTSHDPIVRHGKALRDQETN